jgi:DNA-binding transcriptional MerR regulator
MRLYSTEEIERLRFIKRLVEVEGVNLAGVQRLLAVAEGLQRLRPLLDESLIARDPAYRRRLLREIAALDQRLGLGEA